MKARVDFGRSRVGGELALSPLAPPASLPPSRLPRTHLAVLWRSYAQASFSFILLPRQAPVRSSPPLLCLSFVCKGVRRHCARSNPQLPRPTTLPVSPGLPTRTDSVSRQTTTTRKRSPSTTSRTHADQPRWTRTRPDWTGTRPDDEDSSEEDPNQPRSRRVGIRVGTITRSLRLAKELARREGEESDEIDRPTSRQQRLGSVKHSLNPTPTRHHERRIAHGRLHLSIGSSACDLGWWKVRSSSAGEAGVLAGELASSSSSSPLPPRFLPHPRPRPRPHPINRPNE